MKEVAIIGMLDPAYDGPCVERWGINRAYKGQQGLTRMYFFDDVRCFGTEYLEEVNALGIPVICREPVEQVQMSAAFPLKEVSGYFDGIEYFTCTASYMVAHAVYQGYERIILHGMYHLTDSLEYMHHKPCMEYWIGVARGRGVEVVLPKSTSLCQPMFWQSPLYGYRMNVNEYLSITTLSAAYRACMSYPARFVEAKDNEQPAAERHEISNTLLLHH